MAKIEPYPIPSPQRLKNMDDASLNKLRQRAKEYYEAKAFDTPIEWFKHDATASLTDDMQDLLALGGAKAYGAYFLLIEGLYRRPNHLYDIARPSGWAQLKNDMHLETIEETKEMIQLFSQLGIIAEVEADILKVYNARTERELSEVKAKYAQQCFAGWSSKLRKTLSTICK